MRAIFIAILGSVLGVGAAQSACAADTWALAVHGGAGGLPKNLPPDELKRIQDTLRLALTTGGQILAEGKSSFDAVEAAVRVMEASCVLNAGCGAVLNQDGFAELDAAIMNGADRAAGSVAAVRQAAHPITLARRVMEQSPHVLLVGDGADAFAALQGLELKPRDYFISPRRKAEWERAKAAERQKHSAPNAAGSKGTVGAVALDKAGHLAAATSTGGMGNKLVGRVGDAPIIGAGTFADRNCAVSATGHGEYFIRYTVTSEICTRVKYKGQAIGYAAAEVLDELKAVGGTGGVIALDAKGAIAMPYTTATMIRGQFSAESPAPAVVVEVAP